MKTNMLSSRILQGSFVLSAALASVVAVNGQLAHQWLFDEADGTVLSSGVDSVGGSSWSGNLGPSTIQSGRLEIGGTNFGSGGEFVTAPISPAVTNLAQAGGVVSVSWAFAGWDFTTRQPQFQMGFIDSDEDFIGGLIIDVGGSSAFFGGISDTGVDIPSANDLALAKTLSTAYVFEVSLDYSALTYTVSYSSDGGITVQEIGTRSLGTASDLPVGLAIWSRFTQTDTVLNLDSITVTAIPEPSTYAAIFGFVSIGFLVWRRRAQRA
jgi:hypothetical protein